MKIKMYKSKTKKIQTRIFWKRIGSQRKFEAAFLEAFGYIFWVFRNKQVYYDWPSAA